jgi:hypothetical protein
MPHFRHFQMQEYDAQQHLNYLASISTTWL